MKNRNGMVVAAQPEAAEEGARVLMAGGNAVDAAVTAGFVQCVVDPLMAGIAGYGTIVLSEGEESDARCIEFYSRVPGQVKPDVWQEKFISQTADGYAFVVDGNVNEYGYQSIGTLGTLAGLTHALKKYGSISLADAIAPAVRYAQDGFIMRPHMYHYAALERARGGMKETQERLKLTESGRQIFFDAAGIIKRPGDLIRNPDLASSLQAIADGGADVFYRGDIADRIIADVRSHDGFLSAADLSDYKAEESSPLRGKFRDLTIAALPAPGGGIQFIEAMQALDRFDLRSLGHNSPQYLQLLAEVLKHTTISKELYVGDPKFVEVPVQRLLSQARADEIANTIRAGTRADVASARARVGTLGFPEPKDTTQVCTSDRQGRVVSLTHTLGTCSGVISDGLGFMYNGLMSGFDPRPGTPASIAPGKSRTSSQSPILLFRAGKPAYVLGAPGGTSICSALVQVTLNMTVFGMTPTEAVSAPRISVTSDVIDVSNRIPRYVTSKLEDAGYKVARTHLGFAFAAPHVIALAEDGRVAGGADPQRDGVALEEEGAV